MWWGVHMVATWGPSAVNRRVTDKFIRLKKLPSRKIRMRAVNIQLEVESTDADNDNNNNDKQQTNHNYIGLFLAK